METHARAGGVDPEAGLAGWVAGGRSRQRVRRNAEGAQNFVRDGGVREGGEIFVVEPPSVLAVLRAWQSHLGNPATDSRVIAAVDLERNHDEATVMREDLKRAGVTMSLLFSDTPNVVQIRFHDLRATFCTWARRQQKSDLWIGERSGHRLSGKMLDRYTRKAIPLADLNYEPFPDVSNAIPELVLVGSGSPATPPVC